MPPKTRMNKTSKASKENACVTNKHNKLQKSDKGVKPPRRALADKTNSASDDNASVLTTEKVPKKIVSIEKIQDKNELNAERPRRARRLPPRYKESNVLQNLTSDISQSNEDSLELKTASPVKKKPNSIKKIPIVVVSPLKTPVKPLDNSLIKNRPKRICRLPSKFDDHSISPSKYIPVQPINASTPLTNKTIKINKRNTTTTLNVKNITPPAKESNETPLKQKTLNDFFNKKTAADTNNNARQKRQKPQKSPKKSPVKAKGKQTSQKVVKNTSVKVLGDNKKSLKRDTSTLDVYEFTYDPEEEPPPTKKKKKKTVVKKPPKPRVTVKSNYDKNLAKALAALKSTVSSKTGTGEPGQEGNTNAKTCTLQPIQEQIRNVRGNMQLNQNKEVTISEPNTSVNRDESLINERNYNSVRVEDIAKDMQVEDDYNIDYSPVNSPGRPQTPVESHDNNQSVDRQNVDDPLNLRDDVSFFDDQPAASSSMNVSQRHPLASPWRVEFGNLPIKWNVNAYIKPNMTPAIDSSFIILNDTKKKHVYTDMVPEANESLPQVVETTPSLKQTSIISFIKEVVEKNSNKKRKVKATPVKANSLFEDISNTSIVENTHKKRPPLNNKPKVINVTPVKDISHSESNNSSNVSNETEKSDNQENNAVNVSSPNVQKKKTDNNVTYFGFDESEDQENISPKKKNKARSLRSRTRGILQELNVQKGPTRAIIPVAVKTKPFQSSDVVNKLFDGVKSATEPPVFPDVAVNCNTEVVEMINIAESALPETVENEDSESVHLFEDIVFVHHHKPSRKSYGKSKKVAFSKTTAVDNNSESSNEIVQASSDEDLDDLSFKLPSVKPKKTIKKKKTNKQKLSKKEEKEVEAWAAGFNSMCEDVDEFDLVVE